MSQSETIRNGLVTTLAPLLVANGGPLGQILPYAMSNMTPPCAYITRGATADYDYAMSGTRDWLIFTVTVLVAETLDVPAQQLLDQMLDGTGSLSIRTLINAADRTTLGITNGALGVDAASAPQLYTLTSGPACFGAEWTVSVYT